MSLLSQIDDEADEDLMAVILDPDPPAHMHFCNTQVQRATHIAA